MIFVDKWNCVHILSMPRKNMKKNEDCICIYSRKSKYTGKGESIDNQIELCKEYIKMNFGEDSVKNLVIYEDEGFSGGNLNRPDFKKMMKAARERKFKAIVVYRLDRISRNISDFSSLIEELSHLDIAFISIREQFDTGTPMGRAMMYIASVFSQLERETIAERIRDNMHELSKTGRWLGGVTPTGFASESVKNVTVDGKTKKSCKLKIIPEEAQLVKKIYSLFLEKSSLTYLETKLLHDGDKTKMGKDFTRFAIKAILKNPVYMVADEDAYSYFKNKNAEIFSAMDAFDGVHGILAYNRTMQEKGKNTIYLPENEWIISVGKHAGLIPSKDWIRTQEILQNNKSKSFRQPRKNEAILTGLIYCKCGSRMFPKLSGRLTKDGQLAFSYTCSLKEHSKKYKCQNKNANGNLLDRAVIEQIKGLSYNKEKFTDILNKGRNVCKNDSVQYKNKINDLRQTYNKNERKIIALVDSLTDFGEGVAKKHVVERIESLHQENENISSRILKLEELDKNSSLTEDEFDLLSQLLSTFRSSIDDMSIEQKRTALRSVIKRIVWDGEYAHVFLFGSSDDEIDYEEIDYQYLNQKENDERDEMGNMTHLCEDSK